MKAIYVSQRPEAVRQPSRRPVTDVMSSPVDAVSQDMLLGDALRMMVRQRRRHLAVLDHDGGCVGVLADRAIAAAWANDPASLSTSPVRSAVPAVPTVIGPSAKVMDVARLMGTTGVDAVAVVDTEDRPVGIVTGTDLVALLTR
jgi:CBS domain-containing protein